MKAEETRQLTMCGIMGCVLHFVELVGYLGCDVKKTGCTHHTFLGNLSVNVLVIISLDIKVNVYHDISISDFITI